MSKTNANLTESSATSFSSSPAQGASLSFDGLPQAVADVERRFCSTVLNLLDAHTSEGTTVLLFDVDNTLGIHSTSLDHDIVSWLFRPAILPLLQHIQETRPSVYIGLLSTRSRDAMVQQLQGSGELGALESYVEDGYIISDLDLQTALMNASAEIADVQRTEVADCLDDLGGLQKVMSAIGDELWEKCKTTPDGAAVRLAILQHLHNQGITALLVDDLHRYDDYRRDNVCPNILPRVVALSSLELTASDVLKLMKGNDD
jgi:hypothetical protein